MPDYQIREAAREMSSGGIVAIIAAAIVVIVGLVIAAMAVFGFGLFSHQTADFRGETQKRELVDANGQYRVGAYDNFFNLCASVQGKEAAIKNLRAELDSQPPPDPQRAMIVRASITAQQNARADSIARYNADARKDYTAGKFLSVELPYQLDVTTEETQCVR